MDSSKTARHFGQSSSEVLPSCDAKVRQLSINPDQSKLIPAPVVANLCNATVNPNTVDRLLTEAQARLILPLSSAWFAKQRWLHQPPAYVKIGSRVLYRKSVLLEFIDQHEHTTAADKAA